MSTLTFETKKFPCVHFGGDNPVPSWNKVIPPTTMASELDEDDGLYLNYGGVPSCYPYPEQNLYDHDLHDEKMLWAVLENENLRAVFAPEAGGKLWSLFDKKVGKELLFANPVNKPCNLAIRNAWTSGGVEWNCGFLGHHPHTCDTMFTAKLKDENGEPVLRMYEYERVRNLTYQMDFSLPEGSPVLYCRMRLVNPNDVVVPVYWWSNMAVPEVPGGRVVIPAHSTYTNIKGTVIKLPIPVTSYDHVRTELPDTAVPFDITYPMNSPVSIDYFWHLDPGARRFTCQLDREGYGMFQASTDRLTGRKLFVWGQGPGGNHWQEVLSGKGCDGHYVEIQAGLAASQYETLPMPPHAAWEWMEVYGALSTDPAKVHGEWDGAVEEVTARIEALVGRRALEKKLADTRALAKTPADELIAVGSGWGALENLRREKAGEQPLEPQLDFGAITPEQKPWADLLETGRLPAGEPGEVPLSWMNQTEWLEKLNASEDKNWLVLCQLGGAKLAACDADGALDCFARSRAAAENAWAIYGQSCCWLLKKDFVKAAEYGLLAHNRLPEEKTLALHAAQMLYEAKDWGTLVRVVDAMTPEEQAQPRVQMFLCYACINTGDLDRAGKVLNANGGLEVPDVREGEVSVTGLWLDYEEAKAKSEGRAFDRETAVPPHQFDFRMFAPKKD